MMTITAKDKELRVLESVFLKILKKFLYFLFKIKFFYIFKSFLYTNIVKIIFKNKKYYFNIF